MYFWQEPGLRTSVRVKLPYLDHSITIPDNVQKREVRMYLGCPQVAYRSSH